MPGKGTVIFGEKATPLKDEKERYVKTAVVDVDETRFTVNFRPDGTRRLMLSGPRELSEDIIPEKIENLKREKLLAPHTITSQIRKEVLDADVPGGRDEHNLGRIPPIRGGPDEHKIEGAPASGEAKKLSPQEIDIYFDENGHPQKIQFHDQHFIVEFREGYNLLIFSDFVAELRGDMSAPSIQMFELNIVKGEALSGTQIMMANELRFRKCTDEAIEAAEFLMGIKNVDLPHAWKDSPASEDSPYTELPRMWQEALDKADSLRERHEVLAALKQD